MTHCQHPQCGKKLEDKSDRLCPRHQIDLLKRLDASGYLEPLKYQTVDGQVTLSDHQFLTIPSMQGAETPDQSEVNCSDC